MVGPPIIQFTINHHSLSILSLFSAQTEIEFTSSELSRCNRHGRRARTAKLRLLTQLESIDAEMHQKLQQDLKLKEFSLSSDATAHAQSTTEERDVDARRKKRENEKSDNQDDGSVLGQATECADDVDDVKKKRANSAASMSDDEEEETEDDDQDDRPSNKLTTAFFNQFL